MTTINVSTTLTQVAVDSYNWPVTIQGGTSSSPVVITFSENLTLNASNKYFIIGSEYITIEGNYKTVTISGVSNYPGLIRNGTSSLNGYSNNTIQNIGVITSGNSTLVDNSGWLCQNYYSNNSINNLIQNSYSTGNITNNYTGGIFGNAFCYYGNSTVINCYSTGNISGIASGGICSTNCGYGNGTVTIINCYSTGNISGQYSGGICGSEAGNSDGNIFITNCYSTGNISGSYSGGISGSQFGYNTNNQCKIENCYSVGNVTGLNSGGIVGSQIGYTNNLIYTSNVLIKNCYSLGTIASGCGSICGGTQYSTYSITPIVNIQNCYAVNNPIVSPNLQIPTIQTNCIVGDGSWSDTNANTALIGTPTNNIGNNWFSIISSALRVINSFS